MRARLKGLYSPDIDDLENWSPGGGPFGFALDAMIGPVESEGEESFSFTVCTPSWFAERMNEREVRSGIHTLFVTHYDYRALRAFIEGAVHRAEGKDWSAIAASLEWLGNWEFSNYQP